LFFASAAELSGLLQKVVDDPQFVETFRGKARARAQAVYSWDAITDEYERLFRTLCS
jgi:glycosyltransferase involved in cell wall biosynthesis